MTKNEALSDKCWYLTLKVKNLTAELAAFKSGEKYVKMQEDFKKKLNAANRTIAKLKKEVADCHARIVTVRNLWMDMFETAEKEYKKKIESLENRNAELEEKLKQRTENYYRVGQELINEQEKNQKLMAQLRKDHENSSTPSSQKPNHKKIENGRQKTGRKQGAQVGHEHHPRKRQESTLKIKIEPDDKFLDKTKFRPTGSTVAKQMVFLNIGLEVIEYYTDEFIEISTGKIRHADFPEGFKDDVNYDDGVRAFLFLLNNDCNVSTLKCKEFLKQVTDGKLDLSVGMINGLSQKFTEKTLSEREESFKKLLLSPVMHADFTNSKMGGNTRQVFICSALDTVMYFHKKHKGHEGIKDTPVEIYNGILITDHDKTFYSYGKGHQECLAHVLRYLKGAAENEKGKTWHTQMHSLLREMIHYRNSLNGDEPVSKECLCGFKTRFDEIIKKGEEEYEYEPPGRYYKEGINLLKKLKEYKDEHFLFLENIDVDATNNEAERYARIFKRKLHQVTTFRSDENAECYCNNLGTLATLRNKEKNLYRSVADIFGRNTGAVL